MISILQQREILQDDLFCNRVPNRHLLQLDEKALFQISRRYTDRIKLLYLQKDSLDLSDWNMHLCTDIIQGYLQVSIFIQVSDDVSSYLMFLLGEMGELKLPKKMVEKGRSLRDKIFERGPFLSVLRGLPAN